MRRRSKGNPFQLMRMEWMDAQRGTDMNEWDTKMNGERREIIFSSLFFIITHIFISFFCLSCLWGTILRNEGINLAWKSGERRVMGLRKELFCHERMGNEEEWGQRGEELDTKEWGTKRGNSLFTNSFFHIVLFIKTGIICEHH